MPPPARWTPILFLAVAFALGFTEAQRRVIMASLVCAGAALALIGFANSPGTLLAGRSLMGLALSFYIPAAMVLIATLHGTETRSRLITLHSVGQSVGVIAA